MTIRKKAKKAIDNLKNTFAKKEPKREITPPPEPVKRWFVMERPGPGYATKDDALDAASKYIRESPGIFRHGIAVVHRHAMVTDGDPKVVYDEELTIATGQGNWYFDNSGNAFSGASGIRFR